MIPILFEKNETSFTSNGLGRLRDCIDCTVVEERNSVYYCDFSYPIDGVNYDRIQCGRIIVVEHDESNDLQPFDIVGYERPINGVVTFHAVHISYRQTAMTVSGTNINSLADAFTMLATAQPSNPFTYWTDKTSTAFMASGDGMPHSVRSVLGGMEGSVLDTYGGEYEWDNWTVRLWSNRGELKNFTIRYGLNLTDYNENMDYSNTYNAVIPFWKGQDNKGNDVVVTGDIQAASYQSFNGTVRCIPLDVSDKFESKPSKADVETEGLNYINTNQTYLPDQTIEVDFVRLADTPEYAQFATLQKCKLCDSINVIFPRYGMQGQFKIVKTEYDVLMERYKKLELGTLSVTLSEALGIQQESATKLNTGGGGGTDYIVEQGTSGDWIYRKWNSGRCECWGEIYKTLALSTSRGGGYSTSADQTFNLPFTISNGFVFANCANTATIYIPASISADGTQVEYRPMRQNSNNSGDYRMRFYVFGTWQ